MTAQAPPAPQGAPVGVLEPYRYRLLSELTELIDDRIPDRGVPSSILRSYVEETLAQPLGRYALERFASPRSRQTVATALARHRGWTFDEPTPRCWLRWLADRGVAVTRPDGQGHLPWWVLLLDQHPTDLAGRAHRMAEITWAANGRDVDPLVVSPSGQSVLQTPPPPLATAILRGQIQHEAEMVRAWVTGALARLPHEATRAHAVQALNRAPVHARFQPWWKTQVVAPVEARALGRAWPRPSPRPGPRARV